MKTSIVKAILISLTMGWGAFCPMSVNAQNNMLQGLFDKGNDSDYVDSGAADQADGYLQKFDGYDLGLFDRGLNVDLEDLSIQNFGDSSGDITFQSFGSDDEVPVGDGLLILMIAGAGYVTIKKKKTIDKSTVKLS